MDSPALVALFTEIAAEIRTELDSLVDWGKADGHPGQYQHDVVADAVAVPRLVEAGLGVLSEESGSRHLDRELVAVIDPIDGSTNASRGLPWFATSIAAVDRSGVCAAVVVNQALGTVYSATRGGGAWRDGARIACSPCKQLSDAIVVVNDYPPKLGSRQFRVYGAAALDLCAVADGTFDGFLECGGGLSPWDYLGGVLICEEAGASLGSVDGRDLVTLNGDTKLAPVVGSHPAVRDGLRSAMRTTPHA